MYIYPGMQLGWSRPCSDAGTGDTTGSRFPAPNPELSGVIETGAALPSCSGCPHPAQHLPLRFIPQRQDPNCPLSCFSICVRDILKVGESTISGCNPSRFAVFCIPLMLKFGGGCMDVPADVPLTRPSRCLRTTGHVSQAAVLYLPFQSGPELLSC